MNTGLHSFGGSALDRHLYDFEADDGAAGGDIPAIPDAGGQAADLSPSPASDGAGEPTPPDGATDTAPPPAASLDPLQVQAELEYLRQQNDQVVQAFQQLVQQGATPQQAAQVVQGGDMPLPPDPFSDNYAQEFAAYQQARDEHMFSRFEEMFGQLSQQVQQPLVQQQQEAHAQMLAEQVNDLMADNIARNGDFIQGATPEAAQANEQAKGFVDQIAASLYPDLRAKYGDGPRTLELALTQAADQVRGLLKAAGMSAQTQQANQLATLAAQHGEPAAGAVSGAQVPLQAKVNGESLAAKYSRMANTANAA